MVLQPTTVSQSIGIANGAAGDYSLTTAEVGHLQNGFTQITIGRTDGSGIITIGTNTAGISANGITFNDPVKIYSPAGEIRICGLITGAGDASLYLRGTILLNTMYNNIMTLGNPITLVGEISLQSVSTAILDTTGTPNSNGTPGTPSNPAGALMIMTNP
jgi:hypothetical protein